MAQTSGVPDLFMEKTIRLTIRLLGSVILSHAQMCMKCQLSTLPTSSWILWKLETMETTFREACAELRKCQELVLVSFTMPNPSLATWR